MKSTITMKDFLGDGQGRRFADVASDPHVQWAKWVAWLNDRSRQDRLEMAEVLTLCKTPSITHSSQVGASAARLIGHSSGFEPVRVA